MGHFCVNCGAPLVTRVIEGREVEACANDDFVLWRDPKVASAVVVETPEGIVLGRRAIEPGYGLWCLPGGFVNDDEDPAVAAARECREEIGAAVNITELLGVYHVPKSGAASLIGIGYVARLADGEVPAPGSEMLELGVFSLDAMPPLAFPSHREVLARYAAARAPVGTAPSTAPAPSRPPSKR